MRHTVHFQRGALLVTTAIMLLSGRALAQQRQAVPISMHVGDILELGSDTDVPSPEFSWYMTQNQQFVEAQRGRVFQKREAIAGTYNLDVSVKNEEGSHSEFQSFDITVQDQPRAFAPIPVAGSSSTIVPRIVTEPAMNSDGSVSLPPQGGVLMIDTSQSTGQISQFAIDMDASRDSDANGNAGDDTDNAQTFGIQNGAPFWYFIKPSSTQRVIIVRLSGLGGTPAIAQIVVRFDGTALQPSIGGGAPVDIVSRNNGLAVELSASLPPDTLVKPVLLEWDFGDGAKSLLSRPHHTYLQAGTYTIQLHIRDLTTGQEIYTGSTTVTVEQPGGGSVSSMSSSSAASTSDAGGSIPWKAILVLFVLIILAIGVFVILMWLKNKTTGTIQKRLESAEKKLFDEKKDVSKTREAPSLLLKKPVTITQDQKPVPVQKIEAEVIAEREQSRTEIKKGEVATPVTGNGPVPSWLKNGTPQATPTQPAPVPKQPPVQKTPPAPQQSKPQPTPPPKPVTPVPSVPPPAPKPMPAPMTTPAPAPAPSIPKPAPAPTKNPAPAPASAPMPAPAPMPPAPKPVAEALQETNAKQGLPTTEKPIAFIRAESLEKKDDGVQP